MKLFIGLTSVAFPKFLDRHPAFLPLALSLIAGAVYAASLPPWDFVDEQQHVHYVQHLVERHEVPVMGVTFISPEIVESVFETDRWGRLGLSRPYSDDPRNMGLEGLSYEAYQPPLFYLMLAVPFALLPEPILIKLYGLRILVVLTGTLTVLASFALVRAIWPGEEILAFGVATILALIPERAMAVSRVNNDVLAELMSVVVLSLLPRCASQEFRLRCSAVLGVALGLALLAKINTVVLVPAVAILWVAAYRGANLRSWLLRGCSILVMAAIVSGWFFYRNLTTFGDISGISAFLQLIRFAPKSGVLEVLAALSRGFWGVWWWDPVFYAFAFVAILAFCAGLVGLALSWSRGRLDRQQRTMVAAMSVMLVCAIVGVWTGAVGGWIPGVQGRFILPAYTPAVAIFLAGIFGVVPASASRAVLGMVVAAILILDVYVLLYLLPYHYPSP